VDGNETSDEFDLKPRRLEECFVDDTMLVSISLDSWLQRYRCRPES
jgi:hypothetical protein